MNFLRSLYIRQYVTLGFGVVLLLAVLVGLAGRVAYDISTQQNEVIQTQGRIESLTLRLQMLTIEREDLLRRYFDSGEARLRLRYQSKQAEYDSVYAELANLLQGADEATALQNILDMDDAYTDLVAHILTLFNNGTPDEAKALWNEEGIVLQDSISQAIQEWMMLQMEKGEEITRQARQTESRAIRTVSIIIFLILCVGVLASILISYGISRPIFHLVEQTKAIDLDQTTVIEVQGPREILFLGHSLNHMAQRLRRSKQSLEDHKDRLERELYSASQTQRSLLPEHLPHPSHLDIAFYWQPAQELGGDFYTTMPVSETKSVIILGDVVGKGASAAMAGALTLGLMELSIRSDSGPDVMLSQLNQHLCARFNSSQVTVSCTYVVFDHNSYELAIANAGCIFPIIVREGDLHYVEAPGSPLGLWEKATYDTHKVTLKPNDLFLLSSDGLVEANNRTRELFGFERLESVLRHIPLQDTASAVIDQLLSHMKDFAQGAPLSDDITLIAIRARDVDI